MERLCAIPWGWGRHWRCAFDVWGVGDEWARTAATTCLVHSSNASGLPHVRSMHALATVVHRFVCGGSCSRNRLASLSKALSARALQGIPLCRVLHAHSDGIGSTLRTLLSQRGFKRRAGITQCMVKKCCHTAVQCGAFARQQYNSASFCRVSLLCPVTVYTTVWLCSVSLLFPRPVNTTV